MITDASCRTKYTAVDRADLTDIKDVFVNHLYVLIFDLTLTLALSLTFPDDVECDNDIDLRKESYSILET